MTPEERARQLCPAGIHSPFDKAWPNPDAPHCNCVPIVATIRAAEEAAAAKEREECAAWLEAVHIYDPDPRAPFTVRYREARRLLNEAAAAIRSRGRKA